MKVIEIVKRFNIEPCNKEIADLEKEIIKPSIHRLGLELAGIHNESQDPTTVIGWGTKESNYLESIPKKEAMDKLNRLINPKTPFILLSSGVSNTVFEYIMESSKKHNTPIFRFKHSHLSEVYATIGHFLMRKLSDFINIHGSLVVVHGMGILIIGKSGVGKSEAVLELIQKGHSFISDDTVKIQRIDDSFYGEPAKITQGFLEVRGIGLIDVPKIYGLRAVKQYTKIELAIELLPASHLNEVDRLGTEINKFELLNSALPKIQIPVQNGRTLSGLIEAATNVFIGRKDGLDPIEIIGQRRKEDGI